MIPAPRTPRAALLAAALPAALCALAGCPSGDVGTIGLELATAPGSMIMSGVTQLRLTFQGPRLVYTVDRTESGFDLVLDLEPSAAPGPLVVEGFDATGSLIAAGITPPFALAAINARVVVYMAAPMSVGAAPAALAPARSQASIESLSYGALLAGGVDAAGAPIDAVQIYNAYDHTLSTGLSLLAPRAGITLARGTNNGVFMFGGTAPGGAATGTLWAFDTTAAPSGRYVSLGDFPQLARTGRLAVSLGTDVYLVAGAPAMQLGAGVTSERPTLTAFSSGASVVASDGSVRTVLVGEDTGELAVLRGGEPASVVGQQKGGIAVALPDRRIAVLGGEAAPRDATLVEPVTGAVTAVPGALAETYTSLVAAATPRFIVVAGARAGAPGETSIEVLDAATLAPRGTDSVADTITAAVALPNEQVLLVGSTLQLFTPPPPAE